jgi:hypothetical protein
MNKREFAIIWTTLKTAFSRFKFLERAEEAEIWRQMLSDIPYDILITAVREYILTGKFPPTIADIRETALKLIKPEKDWLDAWGTVEKAIRRYGYMQGDKALASMDEDTAAVVARFGWVSICMTENIDVIRGQFRMAFESQQKAARSKDLVDIGLALSKSERESLPDKERIA